MENQNEDLNSEFFEHFPYNEKGKYDWEIISVSKDAQNKRSVFYGINKVNANDYIYVKQIKINFSQINNIENINILREIYFLVLLINQNYIVQLNDILLDSETNCKHLFLIFKGNSVSLNKLISFQGNDYLSNKDLIKWIIYQISFGLFILHSNKIIHNDIKPSNILINEIGGITICDLGSASFKGEDSFSYTRYYSAPEFLIDTSIKRDEKNDVWGLGVIIIELFLKRNLYFKNNGDKTNKSQLKVILSKFGINADIQNMTNEEIKQLIEESYDKKIIFTNDEIEAIKDENALELIQNLLSLNPKKRFNAEDILKSKYLISDFKDFEPLTANIKELKIQNFQNELIDNNKFVDIVVELRSKLNNSK